MAIETIRAKDANEAFSLLEQIALNEPEVIFRGHGDESYRLTSTLARHVRAPATTGLAIIDYKEMIDHFFACLASVGKLPDRAMTARTKLEYARHYGVPSPLIDFSRSPYIATWMGFTRVRPWDAGHVVVYALRPNNLGICWQKHLGNPEAFEIFKNYAKPETFDDGYPLNTLLYLDTPTSWNVRMLRQLGVFIYDGLQYGPRTEGGFKDLEDFIEKAVDPTGDEDKTIFTLRKIVIPKTAAKDVFTRLDMMGIDGSRVYDNHEGAVADVINSYVFNRRTGYTCDEVVKPISK